MKKQRMENNSRYISKAAGILRSRLGRGGVILILSLWLMPPAGVAQPNVVADKIVGVVDDKIILLSDIQTQIQQYRQQYKEEIPPSFACSLLDQMLTQKLLMTQALLDSVKITDEEVAGELERKIRYYSNLLGGQDQLEKYYGKSISQLKDEFQPQIREQMLATREQQSVISDVKVSPTEVKSYFNSIPADSLALYNSEVELGEIVIYATVNPEMKQAAYDRIREIRDRIVQKGESFVNLAKFYSEDPGSAPSGGELGFRSRGELDPAFEAAAFALKNPGDVSDIIESSFGYHIIQLIERRGERVNVRHILIIPKTTQDDLHRASVLADSVQQLISTGKITFQDGVNRFSMDQDSKNNGGMIVNPKTSATTFETDQLGDFDKSLVFDIANMKPGDFSTPKTFTTDAGKQGYRILWLKNETKPHRENLKDDYDRIQQSALQKKQMDVLNAWLNDKIAHTYVHVDSDYRDCPDIRKWMQQDLKR